MLDSFALFRQLIMRKLIIIVIVHKLINIYLNYI